MTQQPNSQEKNKSGTSTGLLVAAGILFLAFLVVITVYSEFVRLAVLIGVLLILTFAGLIYVNWSSFRRRGAIGAYSAMVTLSTIGIVVVINFLAANHPYKWDLTKNKVHTLSDQTVKLVKGLKQPVKAVLFSNIPKREELRPLLENYSDLSPKFQVEYVSPDKEPTRTRAAGIKRDGTVQLLYGAPPHQKEAKVEDPNEEKLTNAIIKVTKDKDETFCAITGHGEKNFDGQDAEGYGTVKKELQSQSYDVKTVNLMQEGKIPDSCDAIGIIGPTKAFFPQEVKLITDYLANGGRALIALDVDPKGGEYAPELLPIIESWHVKAGNSLVIDPLSRLLGADAAVPVLATFSKENAITKDFQANCYFPIMRPLEALPDAPAGMNVQWLAQTTPKSWAESDFKEITSGKVKFDQGKDKMGPLDAAIAIEGKLKDSKAPRKTRIVVFGTSQFATNNYSRFAGNLDFFMNSASWLMEDENLISIRAKDEAPGKVELTQRQGQLIFLITVILAPLFTVAGGIGFWFRRRKL